MWDGFNKRKFPRLNLQCEVIIESGVETYPIAGVTENLGAGGLCLLLDRAIERFSKCRVKMAFDANLAPVDCEARVVWVVPTQDAKRHKTRYDTGLEFVNMDAETLAHFRRFLESKVDEKPTGARS